MLIIIFYLFIILVKKGEKMKIKKFLITLSLASAVMFIGCGGNQPKPKKQVQQDLAPWMSWADSIVSKYNQNGGLAAWSCEQTDDITDNFSLTIAENKARQQLGKILETRAKGLFEGYERKVKAGKKTKRGGNYEEAIKQTVNQNLKGAFPVAHKVFKTPDNNYQMCAVVVLDPNKIKNILKDIAGKTGIPEDDNLLYEEFKAKKAQERLDQEVQ